MGKSQKQNKFRKSRRKQQKIRKTHKKQQKIRKTQKGGIFPYGVSNSFNELLSAGNFYYDVLLFFKAKKTALRHYGSNNSIGKESKKRPMMLVRIKENFYSNKYIKGYLITFDETRYNETVSYKIHSIYELVEITIKKNVELMPPPPNDSNQGNKSLLPPPPPNDSNEGKIIINFQTNNPINYTTNPIPQDDDKSLNNGINLKVKYKSRTRTMKLNNINIVTDSNLKETMKNSLEEFRNPQVENVMLHKTLDPISL